jgi:hypothetical protein
MNRHVWKAGMIALAAAATMAGCGSSPPSVQPSESEPSAGPTTSAAEQVVVWNDAGGVGEVAVTLPSTGWTVHGDDGYATVPGYENVGFLVFPGDLWIYGDPCHWSTTAPDAPAMTVDEIVSALASQASRNASTPSKITVGGYEGVSITLHVPADIEFAGDKVPDCDNGTFGTLTGSLDGGPDSAPYRFHQGPAQIDEFWVLDVDGRPVALDLGYWPTTPPEVVDEMHAVVESVTFGQ